MGSAGARFQTLVCTAIEHFNSGSLVRSALLLDLAETWRVEQRLDHAEVTTLLDRLARTLDPDKLFERAQQPEDRSALSTVLDFFPSLAPGRLLEELQHEGKRERRRWLLALLVAHSGTARAVAEAALNGPTDGICDPDEWYVRRNMLHLLRRIPLPAVTQTGADVDIALRYSRLGLPSVVVKEAVSLLGQTKDDRAEFALIHLLEELSEMLPIRDAFAETHDLTTLAERVASALAAFPTTRAHRAIVDHAEKLRFETGRPMASLAALGRQDLSGDEATVDRLVGLLRKTHHSRVTGALIPRLRQQDDEDLVPTIEALASTPLPVVRRALQKVARRFPDQDSGRAAARVLAGFAVPPAA